MGWASGASGLGPHTACSIKAASAAVRATGPVTWSVSHGQSLGHVGTSPTDGRSPTTPQNEAGVRSEPPRAVPSASATIPAAGAAHPPPPEPPALNARAPGLRVGPNTPLKGVPPPPDPGQV